MTRNVSFIRPTSIFRGRTSSAGLAALQLGAALMAFGFVIERFSLFLTLLRLGPENSTRQFFSLVVGVVLILFGSTVALASSMAFRRFVRELPQQDVPSGSWLWLGSTINVIVAGIGAALAG